LENEIFFIVQMSDQFSCDNQDKDQYYVKELILSELTKLLPCLKDKKLLFSDLKLWRLALPKTTTGNSIEKGEKFMDLERSVERSVERSNNDQFLIN
jgi:hypothetical protein